MVFLFLVGWWIGGHRLMVNGVGVGLWEWGLLF